MRNAVMSKAIVLYEKFLDPWKDADKSIKNF